MRIDFNISSDELGKFQTSCEAVIRNVGAGSKAATEEAAWEIMAESLEQVPKDTGALAASAFLGVSARSDLKTYRYGAVLGYGDTRGLAGHTGLGNIEWHMEPTNNINPKSGLPASAYATVVHEDLDMPHPNGGKAKFLEDPIRNFASGKFARTAMTYWSRAIKWSNHKAEFYRPRAKMFVRRTYRAMQYGDFVERKTGVQRGGRYVRNGDDS